MTEAAEDPGARALDEAIDRLYPASTTGWIEPLKPETHELSGFSVTIVDGPAPHFLLVTYGLSELGPKESDDRAVSGAGFELTLRVARKEEENPTVPEWSIATLEQLAAHVMTGTELRDGETFELASSVLGTVLFGPDAVLPASIDTPNGSVAFLQCVPPVRDESDALRAWKVEG